MLDCLFLNNIISKVNTYYQEEKLLLSSLRRNVDSLLLKPLQ